MKFWKLEGLITLTIRKIAFLVIFSVILIFALISTYILIPWLAEDYQDSKNMRNLRDVVSQNSAKIDKYKIFTDYGYSKIYSAELWTNSGHYLKFNPLHLKYNPDQYLNLSQFHEYMIFCENRRLHFPDFISELVNQKDMGLSIALAHIDLAYKEIEVFHENNGEEGLLRLIEGCEIKSGFNVPKKPEKNIYSYSHG